MSRAQLFGIVLVSAVFALSTLGSAAAQGPSEPRFAGVEVTVWRWIADPSYLYVSTRPQGGDWRTLDTPLDMSQPSDSGRFHQSNSVLVNVRVDGGTTVGVEVTVWRWIANPSFLYVSTRPEGGNWRTLDTPLDMSQPSDSGRFHQSNSVLVNVPLPDLPDSVAPPDRTSCVIDEAMAARVIASTVQVVTPGDEANTFNIGSAFYIGDSEFVTAGHVIDHDPSWITLRNAHVDVSARIVGYYPFESGDVAILSASAPGLAALEWAEPLAPGAAVAVIGYPEGLGGGEEASITRGIVSRMFTQQGVSFIQTDSAVSPGNSGGPLVDACGRVAGVMSYSVVGERGSEGLHFAVAEPSLARLLQRIRTGQSPPPAESSPSTESGEPTFWDINELVNSISQDWGPTITALNSLTEQWDIINDYESPPSERLAENARKRRDLSQAMVTTLTGLRDDPATANEAANQYLEGAIDYWSSSTAVNSTLESYALDTTAWGVVARSQAERAAAWASYTQARCDLWLLQGYTNTQDRCTEAAEAKAAAEDSAAEASEWEFIDLIGDWRPTTNAISTLTDEWNASSESPPSQALATIAREQRDLAQALVDQLTRLRSHPATQDPRLARYLEAAIARWAAEITLRDRLEQYALNRVTWDAVELEQRARDAAHTAFWTDLCSRIPCADES